MSDSQSTQTTEQPARARGIPSIGRMIELLRQGDFALALGVIFILVVLIMPMPAIMLDMLLAISIVFSVLIMMTTLFIRTPLEFSAFPTVLLIAAMMRLALNLASTRLILANGHLGTDAAGNVIEAFGNFVMQGNFVIGDHRFRHSDHCELHRDHQGLRQDRRGCGSLHLGCDARQTNGHRCGPIGWPN